MIVFIINRETAGSLVNGDVSVRVIDRGQQRDGFPGSMTDLPGAGPALQFDDFGDGKIGARGLLPGMRAVLQGSVQTITAGEDIGRIPVGLPGARLRCGGFPPA